MFRALLPRAVFWDLLKITAIAVTGLSALMVLGGAMVEASREGLDPFRVLMLVPYLVPPALPFILPTCLLFGCTVVYGRMSTNVEITALKAAGIHTMRVLMPALFLSVAISGLAFYLTDRTIPACNQKIAAVVLSDLETNLYAYLRQHHCMAETNYPYEIYVHDVRGDRLIKPIFKHRNSKGEYDMIAQANEATLRVVPSPPPVESSSVGDPTAEGSEPSQAKESTIILKLSDGVATNARGGNAVHFRDRTERMPIPSLIKDHEEKMEALDLAGCESRGRDRQVRADRLAALVAFDGVEAFVTGETIDCVVDLPYHVGQIDRFERKSIEAITEMHLRIVQSATAIPFILLGCPIGILFQKRDFLHSFFACFLPIITIYYPILALMNNISKEGVGHPAISLWLPSLVMAVASIPFLRRVIRY